MQPAVPHLQHYGAAAAYGQQTNVQQYHPTYQHSFPQRHEDNSQPTASHDPRMPPLGSGQYKRCHCKKNKCLKLYCICFAAGVYCNGCACLDCINQPEHQDAVMAERQRILQRSPKAFAPKVVDAMQAGVQLHKKGCRCRKSKCLKKYCECYDAAVACSSICRCENCHNKTAPAAQRQPRMHIQEGSALPGGRRSRSREASELSLGPAPTGPSSLSGAEDSAGYLDMREEEEAGEEQHEGMQEQQQQQQQQQQGSLTAELQADPQQQQQQQDYGGMYPQQAQQVQQQDMIPLYDPQYDQVNGQYLPANGQPPQYDLPLVPPQPQEQQQEQQQQQQQVEAPQAVLQQVQQQGSGQQQQQEVEQQGGLQGGLLDLCAVDIQQLIDNPEVAKHLATELGMAEEIQVAAQNAAAILKSIVALSKQNMQPGTQPAKTASAPPSPGPASTAAPPAADLSAAAPAPTAAAAPAPPAAIVAASLSSNGNGIYYASSGNGSTLPPGAAPATGQVLEAKALPALAMPVNGAPWSAQHLQAADGAGGSGGSEGGPAAGEQGPVEVWYEAVPAGNATAARGMAAGGAVRLTHGSYRIGGGPVSMSFQSISSQQQQPGQQPTQQQQQQQQPSSTLQHARPLAISTSSSLAPAPPSYLGTPQAGIKLEGGIPEATPLPELQGVLMGQPLSGPFAFPSLGLGTEQQHTPSLFSAQRVHGWPGMSPLPDGVPVMWEGMVVGSSLPGLAPTNLAARTAGLSEDALHASLLAEPGTCIDSPDVLPASKRQRMVQQASGLGPSGSQQQQQQQAQQQGDLLADDDEAMASLSDLADSVSDQPHKHEGGRQLRSQAAGKGLLSGWPAGQPGAGGSSSARPALGKVDSLDSQKEIDALQGLCDLRGSL